MDAEVKAEKLRKDERILQAIDEWITSRDDHYERNKAIVKEILEDVFAKMKGRDGFFREHFQEFFFVEKHYKGPMVMKADEFNVNIIIKIPLHIKDLRFENGMPGYKQLQLYSRPIHTPQWCKYGNFLSKWLVEVNPHYNPVFKLDKNEFRQSMESLLAWAVLNIPRIDNYTIEVLKDSPAFTLCVKKPGFPEMNVSLMPVLEFDCRPPYSPGQKGFKWYTLPEPVQVCHERNFQWRPFLYNHENDFLTRHSYLMPVIRQLEKLRDTQEWKVIRLYHIKTLVMQYARSMETDSGLPDTCTLTGIHLFIHMLDRLRNMCEMQHLENFWDSKHNLINTNHSQFAVIVEQLTRMINEITDDSAKLADWILTSEELSMYQNTLKAVGIVPNTDCSSKSLQMREDDERGPSDDIRNKVDNVTKPVTGATAVSGGIESSPSTEAGNDIAGFPKAIDRVNAALSHCIDMLSRRLAAVEQKLAATT